MLRGRTLRRAGVPAAKAAVHAPLARAAMREQGMRSQRECRDFLAHCLHETLRLTFMEEIASGAQYEGRCRDLGNCHPGDGVRYKGRGIIMLTGRANYRLYGKLLGLPLETQPWRAAEPAVAWRIAALYWRRRVHPKGARFPTFRESTQRINGGLNGFVDRLRYRHLLTGQSVTP